MDGTENLTRVRLQATLNHAASHVDMRQKRIYSANVGIPWHKGHEARTLRPKIFRHETKSKPKTRSNSPFFWDRNYIERQREKGHGGTGQAGCTPGTSWRSAVFINERVQQISNRNWVKGRMREAATDVRCVRSWEFRQIATIWGTIGETTAKRKNEECKGRMATLCRPLAVHFPRL